MIQLLFFVWWFFTPAGVANMVAFLSGKVPYIKNFSKPVDFGLKIKGKRLLGSNKTIRGFIFGILGAIAVVYIQIILFNNLPILKNFLPIDYHSINPIIFGGLSGFGALFGDSVKSFFKRQVGVPPGKSWVPFDQIDYILGGILLTSFYIRLNLIEYIILFFVWFLIHPLTTLLGYIFKLKDSPL